MSLLKSSLNKFNSKSFYQLTKNLKTLTNNYAVTSKSKIFFKNHSIPSDYYILRCTSSKSITIKEYKSSRRYTNTWKFERLMGWSLIALIPLAFAIESKEIEMTLGIAGLMHTYWGCQSMCSDYLRSAVVGKFLPIIARLSIVVLTLASAAGIYQLIYKDVGLINMIKEFWSIRGQDYVSHKHLQKVD